MKKLIVFAFLAVHFLTHATATPERIPSKLSEIKSQSWYKSKFIDYQSYLVDNPNDKEAWVQCFQAAQYSEASEAEIAEIVKIINEKFPNSVEAYWVNAQMLGWTEQGVESLEKALVNGQSNQFLSERLILAEITGENRSKWSEALFYSGNIYPSLLNYAYNVLMSVGDNGVLFTEGEPGTLPLWILQDVMKIRPDVTILNTDLLALDSYRMQKIKNVNLNMPSDDLMKLPEWNPQVEFYYALTLPKHQYELLEDKLYVVGLTSLLSNSEIDNYAILKENLEERFLLDYLTVDFNGEPKAATGKTLETNYILPFYLMKSYYDQQKQKDKAQFWRNRIDQIADKSQISNRIQMLLSAESKHTSFVKTELNIKEIDKRMTKVKDNFYASIVEVSNEEYAFFLRYLNQNEYKNFYEMASFDFSRYDELNTVFHRNYHFNANGNKENYLKYPTMDISFEAAKLYCEWLTAQYNMQEDRKFNKVKFRLPTQKEWTISALGFVNFQSWDINEVTVKARPFGDDKPRYFEDFNIGENGDVFYPWYHHNWKFRNVIQNEKGCYLANIKVPDTASCLGGLLGDGFFMTSPVASYFSNDMGLYDVIGNVAEMTDTKGIAMGGSWDHTPLESTISSTVQYDGRDPRVGFRVYMEVIEE